MKSYCVKKDVILKKWYYIDATNKILGRISTIIAKYLKGKHKPEYTPNLDMGDYIIVLNASKILVSGKKFQNKVYYHHTGHVGGLKKITFQEMINKFPERIIKKSVKGMLPKNILGRCMLKKLKIFSKNIHCHHSQKPIFLNV
ncbi:50S ribosomal protein L13 [Buchnera aphidicola]|uniref:Large ribosomal subunit protein uL13 n=1 Tax=Buchnera aphidicola subsp. Tuberolachnus salignus TaxID=98804 RepID=A0A160SZ64_BUCTT|nr:50S ribosomal protein L13 [Buchnera aphidicola]CUR53236.1 50S ribosomal protein L13 [Buchnera aphidicola (Tuberolachnus salignus)]